MRTNKAYKERAEAKSEITRAEVLEILLGIVNARTALPRGEEETKSRAEAAP